MDQAAFAQSMQGGKFSKEGAAGLGGLAHFKDQPELLQQVMANALGNNPRDPASVLRRLMPMANRELLEPMLDKVDLLKFGPDIV